MRHVRLTGRDDIYSDPGALFSGAADYVERALGSVRSHLDMDVAFVSEFVGDFKRGSLLAF